MFFSVIQTRYLLGLPSNIMLKRNSFKHNKEFPITMVTLSCIITLCLYVTSTWLCWLSLLLLFVYFIVTDCMMRKIKKMIQKNERFRKWQKLSPTIVQQYIKNTKISMELLLINIYNKAYSLPGILHHGASNGSIYRVTTLIPTPAVTWLKYCLLVQNSICE